MSDPYYLATEILGYKDSYEPLHRSLADWFANWPQGKRNRLTLLPRGHFKTTYGTINDSIYQWLFNPMLAVLNGHAELKQTLKNCEEIKNHFEQNDHLRFIAPDLCWENPRKESPNWKVDQFTIKRPKYWRVPSFVATSTGASVVGLHFDVYKLDDLVDDKNSLTDDQCRKVIEWFKNLKYTVHDPATVRWDVIGTRWSLTDLYSWLLNDERVDRQATKIMSIFEDEAQTETIFPTRFTLEEVEHMRSDTGSWQFSCQYMNKPVPITSKMFREEDVCFFELPEWERLFSLDPYSWNIFTAVDPNRGQDPRKHDPGCVLTVAVNSMGDHYVIDCDYRTFGVDEIINVMRQHVDRWGPHFVCLETTAGQNYLLEWALKEQLQVAKPYAIKEMKRGGRQHKPLRILRCQPVVERRRLHLPSQPGIDHPLFREIRDYPHGKNDHALDALADIVQSGYEPDAVLKSPEATGRYTLEKLVQKISDRNRAPKAGIHIDGQRW